MVQIRNRCRRVGRSLIQVHQFALAGIFLCACDGAASSSRAIGGAVTQSFCLQPPAAGRIGWLSGTSATPPVLGVVVRGLPSDADMGVFVDEGTVHSAYDGAHFKTGPTGAAALSVRAFRPLPAHIRRLLIESFAGPATAVEAVAYPCYTPPTRGLRTYAPLQSVTLGMSPIALAVDATAGRVFVVDAQQTSRGIGGVTVISARTGAILATTDVGVGPAAIVVDAGTARAFVSNTRSNTVSVLDTRSGHLLRTIPVGATPGAIAVDGPTAHVFVANGGSGTVTMLDARNGRIARTVMVTPGPAALAVDSRTGRVVVVGRGGTTSVLDARTGAILRVVSVGQFPRAVAVDSETGRAFVAIVGPVDARTDPVGPGSVSVLDTRTGAVLRHVAVGVGPFALAVDPQSARAFVTNLGGGSVTVLDARTGTALRSVAVGSLPVAIAVDTRSGRVFVANRDSGSVSVLDATSGRIIRTVDIGTSAAAIPAAVAVDERTGRAFVADTGANSVSVLDATR